MRAIIEDGPWKITTRINQAGNLALSIERDGAAHAAVTLQEEGVIDVDTTARPKDLGEKGWQIPGAPPEFRKYRFER